PRATFVHPAEGPGAGPHRRQDSSEQVSPESQSAPDAQQCSPWPPQTAGVITADPVLFDPPPPVPAAPPAAVTAESSPPQPTIAPIPRAIAPTTLIDAIANPPGAVQCDRHCDVRSLGDLASYGACAPTEAWKPAVSVRAAAKASSALSSSSR